VKEILIVSGKGGTGKTTVAAALSVLVSDKVIVDCDVDAADLWLVLEPLSTRSEEFAGLNKAVVDGDKCRGCGYCLEVCRFDAISFESGVATVSKELCEGCAVCSRCCPFRAISMVPTIAGLVMESETPYGYFVHAQLGIGEENSGRLVSEVRRRARLAAERLNARYLIIDGPPGIGCPVISATTGADLALVVTEPTAAGKHDLERILDLLSHFKVPAVVCINKYDLDLSASDDIARYCSARGVAVVGRIPFDEEVPRAISQGHPIIASRDEQNTRGETVDATTESLAAREVRRIWEQMRLLVS